MFYRKKSLRLFIKNLFSKNLQIAETFGNTKILGHYKHFVSAYLGQLSMSIRD